MPVLKVREIIRLCDITPVPQMPDYIKGVLNLRGDSSRYIFHGVHMMFDGRPDRPWGEALRGNHLVFIGRNLDRQELEAGFASCIA